MAPISIRISGRPKPIQWASSTVLRDTDLTSALRTSAIAIANWVLAFIFSLLGR
jgi:hypothetical protein